MTTTARPPQFPSRAAALLNLSDVPLFVDALDDDLATELLKAITERRDTALQVKLANVGIHEPGAITDRYRVVFWIGDGGEQMRPGAERLTTVALTAGYTDFEQIRKIIAVPLSERPERIQVLGLTRIDN